MLSYKALCTNLQACYNVTKTTRVICLWLPHEHDFGLIAGYLLHLMSGIHVVGFSPLDFISNPLLWVDALEKYHANATIAPTFGYHLVAKRIKQQNRHCDLSHIDSAVVAAEPVLPETLMQMQEVMGIPTRALVAAYGMAETCVFTSSFRGVHVDQATNIVCCGDLDWALSNTKLEIVIADEKTFELLEDGHEGGIFLKGDSLASGYYQLPQITQERFEVKLAGKPGFWYQTGDLGFVKQGKLFITGRSKDLIIINGKNIAPADVERSAETELPNILRSGCSAAFQLGSTTIGLLCEVQPRSVREINDTVLGEIRARVEKEHGLSVEYLGVYPKATIPKTTSGKIRRSEAQKRYLKGQLNNPPVLSLSENVDVSSVEDLFNRHGVKHLDQTLAENGVDSLQLLKFVKDAETHLGLHLDVIQITNIPARELRQRLQDQQINTNSSTVLEPPVPMAGEPVVTECVPQPEAYTGRPVSPLMRVILQLCSLVFVLLVMGVSTIPAAHVYLQFQSYPLMTHRPARREVLYSGGNGQMSGFPARSLPSAKEDLFFYQLSDNGVSNDKGTNDDDDDNKFGFHVFVALLTWMGTFTALVIVFKWLLIRRYRKQAVKLWTREFFQWYTLDRLWHVWEMFVGVHLLNTPFLNLIYKLCGASIPIFTAKLGTFVRETDLLRLGSKVTVDGTLLCHTVDSRGLVLDFARLSPNRKVSSRHLIYPGTKTCGVVHSFEPQILRRTLQPLFIFAAAVLSFWLASGAFDWMSLSSSVLGGGTIGRFVWVFLLSQVILLLLAVLLKRLGPNYFSLWVDQMSAVAYTFLAPWVSFGPIMTHWMRLFGAQISMGAHANDVFFVAPSKAHLLRVGRGSTLSNSLLNPKWGEPILIGDYVSIGSDVYVEAGVHVDNRSALFTRTRVSSGTYVPPNTAYYSDSMQLPAQETHYHVGYFSILKNEIMDLVFRVALVWIPLILILVALVKVMRMLPLIVYTSGDTSAWARTMCGTLFAMSFAAVCCLAWHIFLYRFMVWLWIPTAVQNRRNAGQDAKSTPGQDSPTSTYRLGSVASCLYQCHMVLAVYVVGQIRPFIMGSALHNLIQRLYGANFTGPLTSVLLFGWTFDPALITIGRGVVTDHGSNTSGHVTHHGIMQFAPLLLADNSSVHCYSGVYNGQTLPERAVLGIQSQMLTAVPAADGRRFVYGTPARLVALLDEPESRV
eukprot:m.27227 g.27227  ORF g.27227 m.27227 type:complete len:1201 (+) comp13903_c0_seq1:82-3684(+)